MGRGMGAAVRGGGAVMSGGKSTSSDKGFKTGGRVGYQDGGSVVHPRSGTQGLAKRGYKEGGLTAQEDGPPSRVKKAIGGMMGPPGAPAGGMPQITPQMVQAAQQAQGGGGGPGMMPPPAAGAPGMPPPAMKKGGCVMDADDHMMKGGRVKKAMGGVIGNSMGAPGAGGTAMGALQNQGAIVGAKKRKKLTKLGGMKAPSQPMASPAGGAFPAAGPGNALPRPGS